MFRNFISLGWFCGTAGSMERYGLRSSAGPFDWCFTELEGILELIDTEFADFLNLKNLRVNEDNPRWFRDIKYKISYFHEVREDLEAEHEGIREKYYRRIEVFMELFRSDSPICFIRAVHHEKELAYICQNSEYIMRVLKKHNKNNEIIFLIPEFMKVPEDFPTNYYVMNIEKYNGNDKRALKRMFDSSQDFVEWIRQNSDSRVRYSNLYWRTKAKIRKKLGAIKYKIMK